MGKILDLNIARDIKQTEKEFKWWRKDYFSTFLKKNDPAWYNHVGLTADRLERKLISLRKLQNKEVYNAKEEESRKG